MDFKFSKDSGDSQPVEAPGEKKSQGPLLVLLLILVGGFSYLYFFTSLIKPQEGQKPAETSTPVPQAVKMPLPARTNEPSQPDTKTTGKAEAPKPAAPPPAAVAVTAAKTAAAPAQPAPSPAAKPAQAPTKPMEALKKPEGVKPADKKPQGGQVAGKQGEKAKAANAEAKKPVVADKKGSPVKNGIKKPDSGGQAKSAPVVKTKKTLTGPRMVTVGNYVLEEALSADMGRVRKAGFEPVVKQSSRKHMAMNRLFVSEYNDRATAQATLERLKRLTSDAFIIEQGGKFAVYAGSYLQSESARSEKARLNSAGFPVTVKRADIAVPTQSLSIGPFNNDKDANAAIGKLNRLGIRATSQQK